MASRGIPLKTRLRAMGRRDKSPPPQENQFTRSAEQAFKQADTALNNMTNLSEMLQNAANQQMAYSTEAADQIKNVALQELGYARKERKAAMKRMKEADQMYAQYDDEYRARQEEYNQLWKPVEERTAELALEAGKFDPRVTGVAGADAAQAAARSDEAMRHQMAQMGINPESGRYGDYMKDKATDNAMLSATMINQARDRERRRTLTEGLSAGQSALTTGTNIYRGDQAGKGYMLDQARTMYGLSEAGKGRASAGMTRASSGLSNAVGVRESGVRGLQLPMAGYQGVASTASGLAGQYAPLGIEQAKLANTPTASESAEERMDIMDMANERSSRTRKSYPWAYVFGGR